MSAILERLTSIAAASTRAAIADAGGNEVFFLGVLDPAGKVTEVRVAARGNRHAAPAILHLPRPGEVVIHNHPSGLLTPSDADLAVASELGNDGVGFFIVDNDVREIYVVVEPHRERRRVPIDLKVALKALAPGGIVADALDDYEHRPEQLAMLTAVAEAFNNDSILTVEAGTGTGKSFAYLVPAILWSLANQERVIISTHTINLQEQLIAKDLPLLVQRRGLECTTALVKGRRNYLCQRKAAQVQAQGEQLIDDPIRAELREVLAWAKKTRDGSLSDLPVQPRAEVWEQVVSENDNCLRARCPFYSTCFFYTARRAAAKADILVVNHHLLLADLALREEIGSYTQNAVLPPAARLIVDEAHHLEDVATSFFGTKISLLAIERTLNRLQSARNPARGVLPALLLALESIDGEDEAPAAQGAARWIEERLMPGRQGLVEESRESFAALAAGLEDLLERPLGRAVEKFRVVESLRETPYWRQLGRALSRLSAALRRYAEDVSGVTERIGRLGEGAQKQVLYLGTELGAMQGRIAAFSAALHAFLETGEETCRWLEGGVTKAGPAVSLHSAPVGVGPLLRKALFERFATVTLTSATLAVGGEFDYLYDRLGLREMSSPERLKTRLVDSPFDFFNQAVIAVPRDLPEPTDPGFEAASHEFMAALLRVTGGGTFLLFTSYAALDRAWAALEPGLSAEGYVALRQGESSRHHLLGKFLGSPRNVLFATDSFWEGVDVRGDKLRCVVIARLPFSVPTEPIQQARLEAIEARGGSAFNDHSVPQAVIKLKQGFGRLIRSRDDRGAVVLLDSRIVRRRYGRLFLDSLPPARRVIAERSQVLRELRGSFDR